jgi:hypothetical protein
MLPFVKTIVRYLKSPGLRVANYIISEAAPYTLVAQAMNMQQELLLLTTVIVTHPATIEKGFLLDILHL